MNYEQKPDAQKIYQASMKDNLVVSEAADKYIQEKYGINLLKPDSLTISICRELQNNKKLATQDLSGGLLEIKLKQELKHPEGDEMVLFNMPLSFISGPSY